MTLPASGAISLFAVNDELGLSHSAQIGLLCTNVRTLFGVASGAVGLQTGYGKSNTSVPGAPTGVSASATSCSAISVSFSAPACTGHLTIDSYQVVCTSSGSNSATGASSPISVTGLSALTSYTFKVRAHNSKGYGCYSSTASATTSAAPSSQSYTTAGTYSWVAPAGVTSVSVVAIGGGGGFSGGNGAGLAYLNNYTVTPGNSYTVVVGKGGDGTGCSRAWCGCQSYFINTTTLRAKAGKNCATAQAGTAYYVGGTFNNGGGGGAGGYSGNGGNGGYASGNGSGGGGGGGGYHTNCYYCTYTGGGGGGVGIFGQGSNGCGGSSGGSYGGGGGGGSGGGNGTNTEINNAYPHAGNGGLYGGGGGYASGGCQGKGGSGAVRIVWPGNTRTFPSTCVGSP